MDSALFGDKGIPTVVLGPAGAGAHAKEEWVELGVGRALPGIFYIDLIADFCK